MSIRPKYGRKLNEKQLTALQLTVDGWHESRICEKLNIDKSTLYRWRKKQQWADTLFQTVSTTQESGEVHIRTLVPLASRALAELVEKGSPSVRLHAARLILEVAQSLRLEAEQRREILALEEQLESIRGLAQRQLPEAPIEAEISVIPRAIPHTEGAMPAGSQSEPQSDPQNNLPQ